MLLRDDDGASDMRQSYVMNEDLICGLFLFPASNEILIRRSMCCTRVHRQTLSHQRLQMGSSALCVRHMHCPINILCVSGRDNEVRDKQVRSQQLTQHIFPLDQHIPQQARSQLSQK